MHVRPVATAGLLAATSWLVLGVATPAFAVCDSYSGTCVDEDEGGGGATTDEDEGGGGTTTADERPSTLPLTGGELVLLSTVGIGALVGGTALVVAGRRKATAV